MLAVGWLNSQIVFDGIVQGLAIAVIAVGVVLVYRATRIINFAVGNMGVVGAVTLSLLVLQYGVPFWIALVDRAAHRPGLRRRGRDDGHPPAQERAARGRARGHDRHRGPGPGHRHRDPPADRRQRALPERVQRRLDRRRRQRPGRGRGSPRPGPRRRARSHLVPRPHHDRQDGQGLRGQSLRWRGSRPSRRRLVSTMVWALAAGLSTLSVVLIAGESSTAAGLATLGPQTLSEALAAAVIAGMRSFRVAVLAAVAIGVIQSVLAYNFLAAPGITDLLLFIAVFVAVIFAKREGEDSQVFAFTPRADPIPERLRVHLVGPQHRQGRDPAPGAVRRPPPARRDRAVAPAALYRGARLRHLRLVAHRAHRAGWASSRSARWPLPAWPPSSPRAWSPTACPSGSPSPTSAVASALLALGIGIGSLRVRGLYLAVVTFVFALTAQQYFYFLPFFSGDSPDGANVPFTPGHLWFLTFGGQRAYYYVVLVVLFLVIVVLSRFRDSGVGRRIKAVRDNETAAAAYTVPTVRVKLQAFSLAGALAGLGGALLAGAFANIAFTRELLLGERLAQPRRHGGDRRHGLGLGRAHRRHLRHRHPRHRTQQRAGRAPHLEHRAAGRPAVLPAWPEPDHLRGT